MFSYMPVKPGLKKRRAPLPEEYPNLVRETSTNAHPDGLRVGTGLNSTSDEIQSTTLPFYEPEPTNSAFKRHSLPTGVPQLTVNDITFPADNEALDVQKPSENVKAVVNPTDYGKRYSSGDIPKYRRLPNQPGSSVHSFNASGRLSISLNSISSATSTEYAESQMVDQEDIVNLTAHVRNFSDALSKLRSAFSGSGSDTESDEYSENGSAIEDMHVKAHKHLGKVLSNLKEVMHQYPSLQSNEILAAAGYLISKVKQHNYEENRIPDDFYQAINQLALVFSSSISDFLMGDQEPNPKNVDGAGDCGDEFAEDGDEEDFSEGDGLHENQNDVKADNVETALSQVILGMKSGVDFCLQWTKSWSKYVKDIANYIEKRAQLEAEYTKQLAKLAQTTRHSICEEEYLPFQSTFSTALDQDLEYSQRCQQTLIAITGSKLMEPLMQRRAYHDRARKDMKDQWTKVCKQLHDHGGSVKTSQNMYYKKKQELKKLSTKQSDLKDSKDDSSSVISVFGTSKGRKEEELKLKVDEAKQFYINALEDINKVQAEAENTKFWIVTQTIQLVNECDRTFRSATHKYFDLMHELAVPTPIHFKTLAESCHGYEPGKQFESFVRFKQSTAQSAVHAVHEFEEYRGTSPHYHGNLTVEATSPMKTWPVSRDSDVENGVSPTASPSTSPPTHRHPRPPPSTDDDSDGDIKPEVEHTTKPRKSKRRGGKPSYKKSISKNAATHTFHKIRAPARCSECDSYVFNGVECSQCGLSWHKKCLDNLNTPCSHSRRRPSPMKRMKTFGVRFSEDGGVPVLVTKCVKELNRRGLQVKGIYRVSGVKSKMEGLCQDFETNADSVDLSNQPPHLIASVLKLYIRQLPEPLMTTTLYEELIQLAKESQNVQALTYEEYKNDKDRSDFRRLLERLKEILNKLPKSNYLTTATLIKHLHKVTKNEEHNQMNAQNLAIVFGPTILRLASENWTNPLSSLVDMPHQTRIVALLIVHPQLFDKAGDDEDAVSDQESEKNNDTLVEKFVSPQPEEGTRMPDLYGVRSNRVRGEGPSPMDKLQSPDVQENKRLVHDHDTSRIDEHIDVKDEPVGLFDDNGISLPGSLETQNHFLDWFSDDVKLSEREVGVDPLRNNFDQYTEINPTGGSTKGASPSRIAQGSPSSERSCLPRNVSFDMQNLDDSKSSVDFTETPRQGSDETPPPDVAHDEEQGGNDIVPRRRSKAFSAGKRTDPEMLAKRGSALMNAFIDRAPTPENTEQTLPSGLPAKRTTSSVRDTFGDVDVDRGDETSEPFANSDDTRTLSATVTGETAAVSQAAEAESQTTRSATEDGSPETSRVKAATSSENVTMQSSGDELASWLKSEGRTPRRRRSATYDSDRRNDNTHLSDERKHDGRRSRRTRVSVKDQIMQLEQRGNKNDVSRASSLAVGSRSRASSDTPRNAADELASLENVDEKTDVDGENGDETTPRKTLRTHEPLSRVRVMGGHIGQSGTDGALLINLPSSPGIRSPADNEVPFRALKMDISLDSPRTHSSNSSDEDASEVDVERDTSLNRWTGRGLTPRDSNQAPEFV